MIKDAHNYPLHTLFDIYTAVIYTVPRYQREYSWTKNHCESLFDDILESSPDYFLGSIICLNQARDSLDVQNLELVDGQQRLITLSLLLAAIYKVISDRNASLEEEQKSELSDLKRSLILTKKSDQLRVVPQIQNNNTNDFRAVLGASGITGQTDAPSNAGNRKIFRAYRYFNDRLNDLDSGELSSCTKLFDFLDKVRKCCMVKIEVDTHASAYMLFESLNNRGMPLTPIDLIKNNLMSKLESLKEGQIDSHFSQWNKLLEYLGDDYIVQERFFRQNYNAFKQDFQQIGREAMAIKSNLMQIYERLIESNPKQFLHEIIQTGRLYGLLLANIQDDSFYKLEKPLKDLGIIQGAPSYQLMLYLLKYQKKLSLTVDHLIEIVRILTCFFVRRNLTDTPATRDLIRLFTNIIEKLCTETGSGIVEMIRDQVRLVSASDEDFRTKLEGDIYEENVNVTRFILCALAEQGMTKETWVDLWKTGNKQRYSWSVEHVFPQGVIIPDHWIQMVASGNKQQAIEYQKSHAHKIGNLTISGFNSSLGNKSFDEKRDRIDPQGNFVGYRNGLKLNEDLASASTWGLKEIDARTAKLVHQTLVLFRI